MRRTETVCPSRSPYTWCPSAPSCVRNPCRRRYPATTADALSSADWFKSSYSNNQGGDCVGGARLPGGVMAVRDSKNPTDPPSSSPAALGSPSSEPSSAASCTDQAVHPEDRAEGRGEVLGAARLEGGDRRGAAAGACSPVRASTRTS
ncbi:DUF397 domain-containing protein [Streptomyces sp. NPDC051217]|uniref:DUF397 domain-containing protein n=1 Tax=Streptomyces sp. NPDC051217 TaxID=3365644 RepID=UPI003789C3D4